MCSFSLGEGKYFVLVVSRRRGTTKERRVRRKLEESRQWGDLSTVAVFRWEHFRLSPRRRGLEDTPTPGDETEFVKADQKVLVQEVEDGVRGEGSGGDGQEGGEGLESRRTRRRIVYTGGSTWVGPRTVVATEATTKRLGYRSGRRWRLSREVEDPRRRPDGVLRGLEGRKVRTGRVSKVWAFGVVCSGRERRQKIV